MQTQVTWIFKHRNIIARIFSYLYTYDEKGNPDEYTYPSGYTIKNEYKTGNGALQSVKDKQNGRIIYAPGSFNARGQMLYYALANAGIHAAIAGGITYGADALVNNTAFNWKAYGLNVATSMALAGLSYQKPGAQLTNYSLADLEAAGLQTRLPNGYGMSLGNPPYKLVHSEEGLMIYDIPANVEIRITYSTGGGVDATPYIGGGLGLISEVMFSDKFGTWMGKDGIIRSQDWGGNGTTGGKFKFAGKVSKGFKIGGWVFGAYGMYSTNTEWQNNQISTGQMMIEQVSNVLGFIPTYGTAWSIGWNLGQDFGPSTWYGKNDYKWFE